MEVDNLYQQITDICASNGGATKPMIDKLSALLDSEIAKAKNLALIRAFNRLKSTNRTATLQWLESQIADTESNKEDAIKATFYKTEIEFSDPTKEGVEVNE